MHAHDAKGKNCHLAFGDGDIDLKQRLSMAQIVNARVVLETKTIEALTKTVQYKNGKHGNPIKQMSCIYAIFLFIVCK